MTRKHSVIQPLYAKCAQTMYNMVNKYQNIHHGIPQITPQISRSGGKIAGAETERGRRGWRRNGGRSARGKNSGAEEAAHPAEYRYKSATAGGDHHGGRHRSGGGIFCGISSGASPPVSRPRLSSGASAPGESAPQEISTGNGYTPAPSLLFCGPPASGAVHLSPRISGEYISE